MKNGYYWAVIDRPWSSKEKRIVFVLGNHVLIAGASYEYGFDGFKFLGGPLEYQEGTSSSRPLYMYLGQDA